MADDVGAGQWRRITATVKPIRKRAELIAVRPEEGLSAPKTRLEGQFSAVVLRDALSTHRIRGGSITPQHERGRNLGNSHQASATGEDARTLTSIGAVPIDKAWERDLRSGKLSPDMHIDLHGHHLAGAHTALALALDRAVAGGARLLLVVAGKARGSDEAPRGAIRRELTAWLAHSPHARRILAVRNAHPRHGGAGAIYVLLRKPAPA